MTGNWRYGILAGACLLTVGLYFLPRVVVENEAHEEELTAPVTVSETEESSNAANGQPQQEEAHRVVLPEAVRKKANQWRKQFREAQAASPEKRQAFDSLSQIWKGLQRWDSVAIYAEELLKQTPQDADLQQTAGTAYYEAMARAHSEEEASVLAQKARNYLEERLAKDPDNLDLQTQIGMTYVPSPNPMKGILMLREVLEKDAQHPLALLNLGLLSMRSGQFDKAVERFEKLATVNPNDGQARFYLGVAYVESGMPEKARTAFENAERLAGADSLLRQAATNYLENLP